MNTSYVTRASLIASIYVILTYLSAVLGLASGVIQVRFSEALAILPVFTPAAIPGLTIGCLISNLLTGCTLLDIIFGSVATLIGAIGTRLLKRYPVLSVIPPILSNTIIVPAVLIYASGVKESFCYVAATVCIGEVISCGILGLILYKSIYKRNLL